MYIDNTALHIRAFLLSVGFGLIIGLLYGFCKAVFNVLSDGVRFVFAFDVLFFFACAFLTFLFLLAVNGGRFRLYILAALLLGFAIYQLTLSSFIAAILLCIGRNLKRFSVSAGVIISFPLRLIIKLIGKIFKKIKKSATKKPKKLKFRQKTS